MTSEAVTEFVVGEWVTKDDVSDEMRWHISEVHADGSITCDKSYCSLLGEMECLAPHNTLRPFHIKAYNARRVEV